MCALCLKHAVGALALTLLLFACARAPDQANSPPADSGSVQPSVAPAATTPAPAATAAAAAWQPTALDQLLAPIALYPDALVGQILAASTNSQEVLDGGNWLLQNQNLKGTEIDAQAEKLGFSPAMRSLLQFPTVIDMMCQEIDWTRQLGQAFTQDQKGVLDSIQRLRSQAAVVGNLQSSPQQKVEKKTDAGKEVIEVKPADPKVVYVPQYDPQVVYTTPPPPPPAPVQPAPASSTASTGHSTGEMVATGLLAFGAGVLVAKAFDDDDDYYYPHYGTGVVVVGPRPWHPGAYPYRPVYGPAFVPARGYVPPPGYRYNYSRNNNVVVNNRLVVNNDTYFNQYRGSGNRPVGAQPRVDGAAANEWKGKTTYAGADGTREVARPSQEVARGREQEVARSRAQESARADAGAERQRASVDRSRDTTLPTPGGDRGYGRQDELGRASSGSASMPPERSGALAGVSDGGSSDRAASSRGRESAARHDRHAAGGDQIRKRSR